MSRAGYYQASYNRPFSFPHRGVRNLPFDIYETTRIQRPLTSQQDDPRKMYLVWYFLNYASSCKFNPLIRPPYPDERAIRQIEQQPSEGAHAFRRVFNIWIDDTRSHTKCLYSRERSARKCNNSVMRPILQGNKVRNTAFLPKRPDSIRAEGQKMRKNA